MKEWKKCGYANHVHSDVCDSCSGTLKSGRPHYTRRLPEFDNSIQLPDDWDHSNELLNVDDDLIEACTRRIAQQRTFDKKPLGLAVCYRCGHLLWSCVDGAHTFLVDKPSGLSENEAPASSAYLRAVPSCTARFVYTERGTLTKERWYSCPYCKCTVLFHPTSMLDVSLILV